jgi:nitroimidazol reductase NimA-like FMN-containing flavoprotein (pyridoxamine 5'-phosphate oxidase superfamily)
MVGTPLSTDEIHRLLAEEKIGWLATVSPKGQPHAIPINFGFFNDIVHIIFVDDKSRSVRNIRNNERVSLGINVGEKQGEIKCVLIRGKAELWHDIDALKQAHLKILPKYLPSEKEAENFLQKLVSSGAITKRILVTIKPEKIISWKL